MKENKKISICIATYNGEKYIIEQLNSILPFLSEQDEVIVSDDNSTDNTIPLIMSLNDNRIKLFSNGFEKGYTSNFEFALNHCSGDIIFLSDQDDIWFENKISTCLEFLEKNYDIVVSDSQIINEMGEIINDSFFDFRKSRFTILGNIIKFSFLGCSFAFKREILNLALPFPPNRKYCSHDNWIFLIGSIFYKHKVVFKPLMQYRRHQTNASSGGLKSGNSFKHKLYYRLYLLYYLVRRFKKKIGF